MTNSYLQFGVDWRNFFVEGSFPEVVYAPRNQTYPWLFTHGVNLAEGKDNYMNSTRSIKEYVLI